MRACVRVRTGERERNRIIRALHGAQFWRRAQSVDVQREALSVNTDIRGQNSKKADLRLCTSWEFATLWFISLDERPSVGVGE